MYMIGNILCDRAGSYYSTNEKELYTELYYENKQSVPQYVGALSHFVHGPAGAIAQRLSTDERDNSGPCMRLTPS
jgi:hypothetical protein